MEIKEVENKILQGDALQVLKTLPDESVNCIMTSPPYWALREYGSTVVSIFDGKEDCQHEWGEKIKRESKGMSVTGLRPWSEGEEEARSFVSETQFCTKCGAWKGQLGQEPTFDLYINHLCNIFEEAKRVLRKDGTCWVNIGDTFASTPSGLSNEKAEEWNDKGDGLFNRLHRNNTNDMTTRTTWKPNRSGVPDKCLCMIPQRFAIEMVNRGWILRNVIIWWKPNAMPCSVKDRFGVDFEYLFFFVKSKKYWFETQYEKSSQIETETVRTLDNQDVEIDNAEEFITERKDVVGKSNGEYIGSAYGRVCGTSEQRMKRAVWSICSKPFSESHFATFPEKLVETPLKAGCPVGGIVLDMFGGAMTTGLVALKQNKKFIGIELSLKYIKIAQDRLKPWIEQRRLF